MKNIKLYNYFRSSASYRVRIALHLKKIDFEYVAIHLLNNGGEQNSTNYRKINPIGAVPTLAIDEKIISQSVAIIEFLEETFPNTHPLFPKDPYVKAKVRQVCENINADIQPLQNLKITQYLDNQLHVNEGQKNAWIHKWISDGLSATENILKNTSGKYCFGNEITAADLFLIPQLFTAERFKLDLSLFPTLLRIQKECLLHDAFIKSHPYRQPDTPNDIKLPL